MLGAGAARELLDHLAHVLALAAARHENRVGRLDHGDVLHADRGDEAALAAQERVAAVELHDVALHDVALRVLLRHVVDRIPAPHVRPVEVPRHHEDLGALFEHAVVDGDRGRGGEVALDRGLQAERARVRLDAGERFRKLGKVRVYRLEDRARAPHEHARVPEILARGEESLGGRAVGLLVEGAHLAHATACAGADVAEARLGRRRVDAEGDELALARRGDRDGERLLERGHVANQVIRGQHHHHGIGALREAVQGRDADRGRGVARGGFQQGRVAREQVVRLALRKLFRGDHQHLRVVHEGTQAAYRGIEQRFLAGEAQELLRRLHPRQGPQPRSGAAGEDHGAYVGVRGHGAHVSATSRSSYVMPMSLPISPFFRFVRG